MVAPARVEHATFGLGMEVSTPRPLINQAAYSGTRGHLRHCRRQLNTILNTTPTKPTPAEIRQQSSGQRLRRLSVRYEKRADIHEAFLLLGCALICWHFLRVDRVAIQVDLSGFRSPFTVPQAVVSTLLCTPRRLSGSAWLFLPEPG